MSYQSVSVDAELLDVVDDRTDDLDHRDAWIEDAVEQYLDNADELPDRPALDRHELRQLIVNRAIERKLVC